MKLYDIENKDDITGKWCKVMHFRDMRKSFALGAFSMLKSFYQSNRLYNAEYRLIDSDGKVIDIHKIGNVKTS